MSQISIKSLSGITSITTPAGVDNVFTVHTNDTTERFRVDQTGNLNIAGIITATSFRGDGSQLTGIVAGLSTISGVVNVANDLDVDGHTNLDNVSIAGVSTFTGNVIVNTGTVRCNDGFSSDIDLIFNADANNNGTGSIIFKESGSEKLRIASDGKIGINTTAPGSLVEIYNPSTSGNTVLHVHNDKTGDAAQIRLEGGRTSTNDYGQVLFANRGYSNAIIQANGSADDGALLFKTSATGSGNALLTYLQIASSGNIKLGKNSQNAPGARLHLEDANTTAYNANATTSAASVYLVNTGTNGPMGVILQNASTDGSNTCQATISSIAEGTNKNTTLTFGTRQNSDATIRERVRITSGGALTMSSGTVELQSHMVRVGNRTTSQINAGVSTATGALTLDTTTNSLKYYANASWKVVKEQANDGSSQNFAARSAKALLDDGITSNGVYWLDMHGAYSLGNAKRHYCLMDTSYDGGGWTMLYSMNHGNNFASGSNYSFSLNVGSPVTVSDFTAGNWGYDRRNTFLPAANDQFLIRRSDNNDWKRFVVTTWSPTANSVSNGWETLNRTDGNNTGHPYWALGQMYDASGNAVSGHTHFNGCAKGGNCNSGGGDGSGFGNYSQWLDCVGNSGYGGGYNSQSAGGSPLFWGQNNALSQGGSLYIQMFYRKAGTQ